MRIGAAVLLGSMLVATVPAWADDIDMSTIKCKDFIAADKGAIGNIMIWLEGYYTREDAPPILNSDKMQKDGQNMGAYCGGHGDDSIITAAEKVMPVK